MASGFSASVQISSDIIYDFNCSLCEDENLNTEATFYCDKCSKPFCDVCVKLHGKFHKDHAVLGRESQGRWGRVKSVVTIETCDEHDGEEIKMYCDDHDKVCCHVCVSTAHRTCRKVDHVPKVAKGILQNTEFKALPKKTTKVMSQLTEVIEVKKNNLAALEESCESIISAIQELRYKMVELLEEMEKRTVENMDKLKAIYNQTIQSEIDTCTGIHDEMKRLVKSMQGQGKENETPAFVGFKKCQDKLAEAENLLRKIPKEQYKLTFKPDKEIETYLSSRVFGELEATNVVSSKPNLKQAGTVYKIQTNQKFSIKCNLDSKTCQINGICRLPNGNIVLVDWENENVKLLSGDNRVIDTYTPHYPHYVCLIADNEVAVSVSTTEIHEIHFMHVENGKLAMKRTIQLEHSCFGLDFKHGSIYVASKDTIYIYTLAGKLIKTIYEDTSINKSVWRVTVSDDGEKIYTRQKDNDLLVTLDKHGNQLSSLSDPDLKSPTCIAVAGNGSVFVCGTNTIIQVDMDGKKKLATLARQADGINKLKSLWFDKNTSKLYIGQKSDEMIVMSLNS